MIWLSCGIQIDTLKKGNFQLNCKPVHEYRSDITFVKEFYGKQYQMPYGGLQT